MCLYASFLTHFRTGETDVRPDSTAQGSFLERERALLGEDADLFAANDNPTAATVEDGDDDLLGGDDDFAAAATQPSGEAQKDLDDFESSFPAIDTQNEVRLPFSLHNIYPPRIESRSNIEQHHRTSDQAAQ